MTTHTRWTLSIATIGLITILCSCTTSPTTRPSTPTTPRSSSPHEAPGGYGRVTPPAELDLNDLSDRLQMGRSSADLGFQHKAFNTCRLGVENPGAPCRDLYYNDLRFRLQCRATEGTVEHVSNFELTPLYTNSLKWQVGPQSGHIPTSPDGFGHLRWISTTPNHNARVIFKSKTHSLSQAPSQLSRLILPNYWCR